MTDFTLRLHGAIPALWRSEANAILEAAGHGPDNFSVRLTSREDGVTSHYGLSTVVQPSFMEWIASVQAGAAEAEGAAPDEVAGVLRTMLVAVAPRDADAGFPAFLSANALRRVEDGEG